MKIILTTIADKTISCANNSQLKKALSGSTIFQSLSFKTDNTALDCEVSATNTRNETGEIVVDFVCENFRTITCSTFEEIADAVETARRNNYLSVSIRASTKFIYCKPFL